MDSFNRDLAGIETGAAAEGKDSPGKRSRSRDSLFMMATLKVGDEPAGREVRIRNLSEGGMMADYAKVVPVGTPVMLDMRGIGEVEGQVAWCTDGRIGIALAAPIDPMRARKPVGGGSSTPLYAKSVRFK